MKNTFGNSLSITIFGESHGPYIGAVLDGLAPGIKIDEDYIRKALSLRRPYGKISTARVEDDEFSFASGVFNGYTTGTPLCILIPNKAQKSSDYTDAAERIARPGHADYTGHVKFNGFEDYRGGGHFSGRITAAIVAAGAVVMPELNRKGIKIATHLKSVAGIKDRDFKDYDKDVDLLNDKVFAVLDDNIEKIMLEAIERVAGSDSVGGCLESVITGLPAGLGEPWFDSFEGVLSHALYSIPAVKGVQFGAGFDLVDSLGSEFNDEFFVDNGKVITKTNNNGGINGGITNGMPVLFRTTIKPTPSIFKEQDSVTVDGSKEAKLNLKGRHDPAIIHRARIVVDMMTALTVYDIVSGRYGTCFFGSDKTEV